MFRLSFTSDKDGKNESILSAFFTERAVQERVARITQYRQETEDGLDTLVARTPESIRNELWNYSEITDEREFEYQLSENTTRLSAYFDCAILVLDEIHQSEGSNRELAKTEYAQLLRRMRDAHLIIDALVNSGKGPGAHT